MANTAKPESKHQPLTAHSRILRAGFLGSLDGRSAEGRFVAEFQAQLAEHVGGEPSVPQTILIKRAAVIALRLHLLDRKYAESALSDYDCKLYNSHCNTLRLLLRELGLKKVQPRGKTLKQYLEANYGAPAVAQQQ